MSLFRGTFFLKRRNHRYQFFKYERELWVPIEETCRVMGTMLENCGKHCKEEQRICKNCLMILLRFEEICLCIAEI